LQIEKRLQNVSVGQNTKNSTNRIKIHASQNDLTRVLSGKSKKVYDP
jgi:hypothetical protein